MQVKDSTALFLQVIVSARNLQGEVALLAHSKSVPKFAEKSTLKDGKTVFLVNKNNLGDGITSITLFDNNQQPVCERLYFKRPTQSLALSAKTDKKQYAPREKITIDLTSALNTTPAIADLSVSVYLVDSLPAPEQTFIESYLGLTSDLKGTVESPG